MSRRLRVAVANWTSRMEGGAERYLRDTVVEMLRADHEVAFVHEIDGPGERAPIFEEAIDSWSVAMRGRADVIRQLRSWKPEVIVVHGLLDPVLEAELQSCARPALVAHSYYGTCISGEKTWKTIPLPCSRVFGPGCLAHYYPHRCGGFNPLTMLRLYQLQHRRSRLLRRYDRVIALSRHMEREMLRAGARAVFVPLIGRGEPAAAALRNSDGPWRLLFAGRLTFLKGGDLLIDALERLPPQPRPIEVVFAGDGPRRPALEKKAARLMARRDDVSVKFRGWLAEGDLEREWRGADLFIFPSIWPEPLGLVGLDASRFGVPAIGFDVGGVGEWLEDGVNGYLVSGDPPTAGGLAEAIQRAIGSSEGYRSLLASTARAALELQTSEHTAAIVRILSEMAPVQGSS